MPTIYKDVDFFVSARTDLNLKNRDSGLLPFILPCVIAAAVILMLWGIFYILDKKEEQKLSLHNSGISGISISDEDTGSLAADITAAREAFDLEPKLETSTLKAIFQAQPQDLRVYDVAFATGKIIMNCQSSRELCGADFAGLLRKSPELSAVEYTGVSAVDGGYSFTVTMTLAGKGRAGDEN